MTNISSISGNSKGKSVIVFENQHYEVRLLSKGKRYVSDKDGELVNYEVIHKEYETVEYEATSLKEANTVAEEFNTAVNSLSWFDKVEEEGE